MRLPETGPRFEDMEFEDLDHLRRITRGASVVDPRGRYLHWHQARRRTPPDDMTSEEWWILTRIARDTASRTLPLRTTSGDLLRLVYTNEIQQSVHAIDQEIGERVGVGGDLSPSRTRRYVRSLEEEAITSSQLEGATTTRRVAKWMLATGRSPRDDSERMIVNNFPGHGSGQGDDRLAADAGDGARAAPGRHGGNAS